MAIDPRSYGEILRLERERAGYDVAYTAQRLHIRPDILESIENSDFDRLPARGYCKNMIRAYARLLRLDENLITQMYLDEVHEFETGLMRNEPGYGGRSARASSRRTSSSSSRSRMQSDDEGQGSRRDRNRSRQQRQSKSSSRRATQVPSPVGSIVSMFGSIGSRNESKVPRSFNTIGSNPPYAQQRSARGGALSALSLPLLLAIVVAVIVLIIVIVVVTNGSRQAQEEVPQIPISGLTDTSDNALDSSSSSTVSRPAPESVDFEFSVPSGQQAWVEIYENGSSSPTLAEVVEGPDTRSFDVSGTLTIKTASNAVTAKVDDEPVQLVAGSGVYTYTVNFSNFLSQWAADSSSSSSSSKNKSSSSSSSTRSSSSGS